MNIRINADGLATDLLNLANKLEPASEGSLDAVASEGKAEKGRQIDPTYRRAIPKDKHGRAKWERDGAWRDGQRIRKSPGQREIGTDEPARDYEPGLAKRATARDGVNRSNPAAEKTHGVIEPKAGQIFEDEMGRRLGL